MCGQSPKAQRKASGISLGIWHLGLHHMELSETYPGNELLNLGQGSIWSLTGPQRKGGSSSLACPVLKSFPCSISKVRSISFFSSSPFSHPRPETRLERLAQPGRRARCGAGMLGSIETYRNVLSYSWKEFP